MTEYCGFVCSDVVEKAREIRKELDDFKKYNPNEAKQVKLNVLNALGIDVVKLIKNMQDFIPKLEGDTARDTLLERAVELLVYDSLDLMKVYPLADEELGITKKRPSNEVICSYCSGGPIRTYRSGGRTLWRCKQCQRGDFL